MRMFLCVVKAIVLGKCCFFIVLCSQYDYYCRTGLLVVKRKRFLGFVLPVACKCSWCLVVILALV